MFFLNIAALAAFKTIVMGSSNIEVGILNCGSKIPIKIV